jgi:drug/metabolite transporter (DMT)-like permease
MNFSTAEKRDAIDGTAAVIMVGLTFTWGLNQVAIKVGTEGFSPVFMMALRSGFASLLVFLWCRYRGISLFDKDGTLPSGLVAGFLFGAEFILLFIGVDLTTAARSALMVNTMPFWILLGGHFLLGERITAKKLAGLLLAFVGVVLVFTDQLSLPNPSAIHGDALILAGAILWAATTLVIKRSKLSTARAEKTLLYQLVVSAVMVLPIIPFNGPPLRDPTIAPVVAVVFQSVFVVSFTYVIWFSMIRIYPAAGLSSFTFLTPVFGVACGGILLGEPLSVRIFLAMALIAAGLFIVNRPPPRTRPAP